MSNLPTDLGIKYGTHGGDINPHPISLLHPLDSFVTKKYAVNVKSSLAKICLLTYLAI